eukprot:762961-Hanusia_phi.AAC.5
MKVTPGKRRAASLGSRSCPTRTSTARTEPDIPVLSSPAVQYCPARGLRRPYPVWYLQAGSGCGVGPDTGGDMGSKKGY